MWYVSEIGLRFGVSYYVPDITDEDIVSYLEICNSDNKEKRIIVNLNCVQSNDINYLSVDNIFANFSSIKDIELKLSDAGINTVFGLNLTNGDVFSTTEFGWRLYDIIDFECEKDLSLDTNKGAYSLLCYFVVFTNEDSIDFELSSAITLDRIILNDDYILKDDKIIIIDDSFSWMQVEYKILDKGAFAKLLTLKGKARG